MLKVYGCSDDLIEVEGDITDEFGCYGTDEDERGVLVVLSDGTILEVKYGKADMGVWEIRLLKTGILFDRIEPCLDENSNPYSDIAYFKDGIKYAFCAREWQKM